jgi:hypothetical protein
MTMELPFLLLLQIAHRIHPKPNPRPNQIRNPFGIHSHALAHDPQPTRPNPTMKDCKFLSAFQFLPAFQFFIIFYQVVDILFFLSSFIYLFDWTGQGRNQGEPISTHKRTPANKFIKF